MLVLEGPPSFELVLVSLCLSSRTPAVLERLPFKSIISPTHHVYWFTNNESNLFTQNPNQRRRCTAFSLNPILSFSTHMISSSPQKSKHSSQNQLCALIKSDSTSLPPHHTIGKMIFHPSVCSVLLLLLHGGHPGPIQAKHKDNNSPAPTYSPTTERPSLPIPSYSPTQSFKAEDLVAPSPPNCAPIGSRTSESPTDSTPVPTGADDRRYPPPSAPMTPAPVRKEPTDVTFRRGHLKKDIKRLGIKVSKGITVRVIANAGRSINLASGKKSALPFHSSPDGAAVFPLTNGGYVYVSNSEVQDNRGGVYGVYMDDDGNVIDYKRLLSGTTRNCSGGATPWKTYVSCEEYGSGQCYQVDPDPASEHHLLPEKTVLGGKGGGNYEAVVSSDIVFTLL